MVRIGLVSKIVKLRSAGVLQNRVNGLVVQNDVEQRTVDLQRTLRTAGVFNETQFPESVHEETDSRASCPDHLSSVC